MPGYRPDIDGIRAWAIITIMLYHAWPAHFGPAVMSVDIFFVISGFLITTIICRDVEKKRFTYWQFYRRRILRILPPAIIVICVCLLAGFFTLTAEEYARLARNARAGALFEANFSLMADAGYFDADIGAKPMAHFWTLAIEEQFYIIYPLLLLLCARMPAKILLVAAIGISAYFFGGQFSEWLLGDPSATHYYSPFPRAFDLSAGAFLALATRGRAPMSEGRATWFAGAGVALIVLSFFLVSKASLWPQPVVLLPVAGIVLVVHAGPNNPISRVLLCNPAAVFIGIVSYEFYLWHWPLLSFAGILAGGQEHIGWLAKLAIYGLALLLAWLMFSFVGAPLRVRFRASNAVNMALLCILGMVALAAHYVAARDGLPQRIPAGGSPKSWEAPAVAADVARAAPYFPDWIKYTDGPNQVALEDAPDKIEIALIGDSHAFHLYPGLAEALDEKIGVFPASGQAPFPQIATFTEGLTNYRKDGHKLIGQAYQTVIDNPNIRYVVLAHSPGCSIDDTVDPKNPQDRDATALMERAMRESLARLRDAGKKVLIVLDNPGLDFDPTALENRPLDFLTDKRARTVSRELAAKDRARTWFNAICAKVAGEFDNVHFVDLFDAFCKDGQCASSAGGKPLYFDRSHLTLAGSRHAAPVVAEAIRKMKKGTDAYEEDQEQAAGRASAIPPGPPDAINGWPGFRRFAIPLPMGGRLPVLRVHDGHADVPHGNAHHARLAA